MICRKAHVMLPEANFISPWCQSPSSRAQNRDFCALLGFGTLVFGLFEHKIGVFVLGKGSGERSVIIVWPIMVCRKVFVFVFYLIWRVWELVLRGIVECCIFDFWRLGGDWLK